MLMSISMPLFACSEVFVSLIIRQVTNHIEEHTETFCFELDNNNPVHPAQATTAQQPFCKAGGLTRLSSAGAGHLGAGWEHICIPRQEQIWPAPNLAGGAMKSYGLTGRTVEGEVVVL